MIDEDGTISQRDMTMARDHLDEPAQALHEHLQRVVHWKTVGLRLLIGLCLLIAVVWFGRHAGEEIKVMESWIADHGVWGWVVFVGMIVVFTSMFVPDTLLAIAAGILFGLPWGTVLTVVGAIITAALNFLTARTLLRPRIEKMLDGHPKLRAIQAQPIAKGYDCNCCCGCRRSIRCRSATFWERRACGFRRSCWRRLD